ncbi:putative Secreted protein containing PEP-CTERM bacterial domain [Desulfosarcina cetonica]|uniref:PEP-CTERM sorting domain-containing protein n=1 Tax=Desulfosarcina cetonica TaxID=90730 RepID=UPI0006D1F43F|nr:PEP-CTERM sorting domain-containing protein [Desulfosarcina cetonica]VTR71187.1 putative Secreted protein containing PEP-CTERM bacterial domain [Desulfosarcina cetonica]
MKKVIVFLCSLVLVFGLVSVASAVPTTWTDTIDWNPDQFVDDWNSVSYTHDITDDGFDTIFGGDYITDYSLTIRLYDDQSGWDEVFVETAFISQPGIIGDGFYNFSYTSETYGWSLAGLIQLNLLGTLDVTVTSVFGDFYLDYSILTANGESAPVPEPATMLLLGTGLVGLAGASRKKIFKKS